MALFGPHNWTQECPLLTEERKLRLRGPTSGWLRENVRARKARRIVFSIVLSRQPSPALLFFKLIEVETKFPFANSISAFSRGQDPHRTSLHRGEAARAVIRSPHSGRPCAAVFRFAHSRIYL